MDIEELREITSENDLGVDELIMLLAEYIGDKEVTDNCDIYLEKYYKWWDNAEKLYRKCKEIGEIIRQ